MMMMAADRYGKGSILYKILIVVLAAALVVAIVYPKKIWDDEAAHQALCRERMADLYNAELQYRNFNDRFTASSAAVIEFIQSDPRYLRRLDSLIVQPLREAKKTLDSLQQIQAFADSLIGTLIAATASAAIIDSVDRLEDRVIEGSRRIRQILETIRERMAVMPNMPVAAFERGLNIITRKDYFFKMEVIRRMLTAVGNPSLARASSKEALENFALMDVCWRQALTRLAAAPAALDSLRWCPTVQDSFKIALVDGSVRISCPIDSTDIRRAQADFFKSRIGALKISNHGRIDRGEKSWASRP
ncbi:MAG: hypothetical protein ONB46_02490 [candidate division KSB1 bacterium]|nr:hypothetical protein [candidate division KSB1 bacterium]